MASKQEKTMHFCGSFVGQARLQFAGLHSLFLALWCTVIEIGGAMTKTYFSLNLQMLFSLPIMYNCICILPYLGFKDTSFAIFASTSHVFDNVRMLLIEILHPQLALSITCGYTSLKFCIFNFPKSIASDISPYYSLSDIHIYYHYIFDTVFINIVGTNCQKMARVVILWYTSIMSRFSYLL